MMTKINEAVAFIKNIYDQQPSVGIVLGSGLGNFTKEIEIEKEIPYGDIPHFPESTVEGHSGKLIFGVVSGKKVVAMAPQSPRCRARSPAAFRASRRNPLRSPSSFAPRSVSALPRIPPRIRGSADTARQSHRRVRARC